LELRHQQRLNEIDKFKFQGTMALLMFAVFSSAVFVFSHIRKENFKLIRYRQSRFLDTSLPRFYPKFSSLEYLRLSKLPRPERS
ncbi:MAG TPA: hypothetical protein VGU90_12085, partial [Terriglobales bacterium]|nr:hypothetical protein [Terriglobales bacterium]